MTLMNSVIRVFFGSAAKSYPHLRHRYNRYRKPYYVKSMGYQALASGKAINPAGTFDYLAARVPGKRVRRPRARAWRAFAKDGRRELVLARGRHGYIAKHRRLPADDVALILANRQQLEAGYSEKYSSSSALRGHRSGTQAIGRYLRRQPGHT